MIALDASAIVAILRKEPEAIAFNTIISRNDCLIGTPTRLEVFINIRRGGNADDMRAFRGILALKNVTTIEFTVVHLDIAEFAYDRFGRGTRHPAQLNYGDCMAYAIARVASVPLLYKGNDFVHTDIAAVPVP